MSDLNRFSPGILTQPVPQNAQMWPAAFFDLDGTIRRSKSGKFIDGPDDVELFDNVESRLHQLKGKGFLLFGVTNQGGVAFGYKTVEQVREEIQATSALFEKDPFDHYQYCPFHPDGTEQRFARHSPRRKPGYGMLVDASIHVPAKGTLIDWEDSLMVGDRPEDRACAEAAGIDFEWAWDFFYRESPENVDPETGKKIEE